MPFRSFARRLLPLALLLSLAPFSAVMRADLVWEPGRGWRVEGGVLTLLSDEDNDKAILLMNKARAAQEAGHSGSAIRRYQKVAKRYPRSIYAPEAQFQMGHLYLGRRQYLKAYAAFETVVTFYPNYARFNEILAVQMRIAGDLADGKRPRIWGLSWFPGPRQRKAGAHYFERIANIAPYAPDSPIALYRAASTYLELDNTDSAAIALDTLITQHADHPVAQLGYLKLAEVFLSLNRGPRYDQGGVRRASEYYQDFVYLYPKSEHIAQAEKGLDQTRTQMAQSKILLGDWYLRWRKNFKAARVFYNEAITLYPQSAIAETAKARLVKVDEAEAYRKAHPPRRYWFDWLWR